ncbi:extracellular solute-binding protein [Anaerolinea thermophila]|uniref:extracellular solute-binding protein n=2 Tax=Anaerolinea TaxID=233189 RepID=UPI0026ECFB2C|nr:extracellular solute-binding protein [Anaerolinea thermophila]
MLMKKTIGRILFSLILMLGMLVPVSHSPVMAATSAGWQPAQAVPGTIEIRADSFGRSLTSRPEARTYSKPAVYVQTGDRVTFDVTIPREGEYTVWFDMAAVGDLTVNPPEGSLQVDGDFPLPEARRVVFPLFYQNTSDRFPLDRYGNEILIPQQRFIRWTKVPLRDAAFSHKYPLRIVLSAGKHTVDFRMTKESMLLGSIYLEPFQPYPSYAQYLQSHSSPASSRVLIELEAEFPSFKNDTAVRPVNNRSLGVTPYDTYRLLLNALGGDSWVRSGSAVYYEFSVPQEGMYQITFRALQNTKSNFTSFRKITLDDQVLFDELSAVPFPYTSDWEYLTLGGEAPYNIFLTQGTHVLGIEVTVSPYVQAIEKIRKVLLDINDLSLEIKRLTGNQVDVYKEWNMSDYIPDLRERLLAIAADLEADVHVLSQINRGVRSQELLAYQMAIENIRFLAQDPDKMPIRLNRFSEGTGSAAQLLGSILPSLQSQPLTLDKIYIHSPDNPPQPVNIPVTTSLVEGVKRFIHSFQPVPYQSIGAGEDEIEVWVNRPRQYVDLMQTLADQQFTPQTGIKVRFAIMPNESKLALAVAAGIQPDVALGISTNIPYELAIRNALYDLRSFDDFDAFIRIYSPGSLLSYIIDDSVYAIPETQDFWVTYYRRDVMGSLGLPIPQTWQEVIEILPELQRYGLNYNTPLSSGAGLKGYLVTAPYIFNHGAQLYTPDGMSGLGTEEAINAIRFMAESFTIYGMPLTTANFYDRFRYGSIPIGISNFETYIKLLTAAPEIDGLWGMSLYPATVLPDGRQLRYATGSAQACIMFADTDKPAESWAFLKWWMSTETQKSFQQELILNYGLEYLWNSANLEAFKALPIPEEHKEVILEQWQWLQEPVKLPGSYMQERELSNVWNRIVFDGANPRVAIDNAVIVINREILRKMEEFGYIQNGVRVREIKVPTIETVKGWMENANR